MNTEINLELQKLLIKKNIDVPVQATIADVVMWLHEKHKIWIQVFSKNTLIGMGFKYEIKRYEWDSCITDEILYNIPTEAYQEAILYTLKTLI